MVPYVYISLVYVSLCMYVPSVCRSYHVYVPPYMSLRMYILLCVSLHVYVPSVCMSPLCVCLSVALFFHITIPSVCISLRVYVPPYIYSTMCILYRVYTPRVYSTMYTLHRVYTPPGVRFTICTFHFMYVSTCMFPP